MAGSFRDAEYSGWTARADRYDEVFTPISNQVIPHMLAALGDLRGKHVLDICCGAGHMAAALAEKGAAAEGIDFAPTMIAKASMHYPSISFRQGDAEALDYPNNSFDHVVCCYLSGTSGGPVELRLTNGEEVTWRLTNRLATTRSRAQ